MPAGGDGTGGRHPAPQLRHAPDPLRAGRLRPGGRAMLLRTGSAGARPGGRPGSFHAPGGQPGEGDGSSAPVARRPGDVRRQVDAASRRSRFAQVGWPRSPTITRPILAIHGQLAESEWWPPEVLAAHAGRPRPPPRPRPRHRALLPGQSRLRRRHPVVGTAYPHPGRGAGRRRPAAQRGGPGRPPPRLRVVVFGVDRAAGDVQSTQASS